MCGRFTIKITVDTVVETFGVSGVAESFTPSFNVAPGRPVPIVVNREGLRILDAYRWGLIPFWAKDESIGFKTINARAETVHEKPAFRAAFRKRRCLIIADGFYEWKKEEGGKVPYYIFLKDRPLFAFAGLWELWRPEEGEPVRSCTIVTTEANPFMRDLHHRMPVILPPGGESVWLDPEADPKALRSLLVPYGASAMDAHPVSTRVNSPKNDTEQNILPLRDPS